MGSAEVGGEGKRRWSGVESSLDLDCKGRESERRRGKRKREQDQRLFSTAKAEPSHSKLTSHRLFEDKLALLVLLVCLVGLVCGRGGREEDERTSASSEG